MVSERIYLVTKNRTGNYLVLLLVAVYLGVIIYQGNLGSFLNTLWTDIKTTRPVGYALWQWALALIILLIAAQYEPLQGPVDILLGVLVVAMLIQLAEKQPQMFKSLNMAVSKVFGAGAQVTSILGTQPSQFT